MSVFVKPLKDLILVNGNMIETGPKFYVVPSPTQYMTLRSRSQTLEILYGSFVVFFYNFSFLQSLQWI